MKFIYGNSISLLYQKLFQGKLYLLLLIMFFHYSPFASGQAVGDPVRPPLGMGIDKGIGMYNKGGSVTSHANAVSFGWYRISDPGTNSGKYPDGIPFTKVDLDAATPPTIPAKYAFYPRYNLRAQQYLWHDGTTIAYGSTGSETNRYKPLGVGEWVIVRNVGRYKGVDLDMKVSLIKGYVELNNQPPNPNPGTDNRVGIEHFYLPTYEGTTAIENFMYMRNAEVTRQRAQLVYEFYQAGVITATNRNENHDAHRVAVAGIWNIFRVNHYKSISVEDPTEIFYVKQIEPTSGSAGPYRYYEMYFKQPKIGGDLVPNILYFSNTDSGEDNNTNISYTFEERDRIYMFVQWMHGSVGYLRYDTKGFMKIELGQPSLTGYKRNFLEGASYDVNQLIPSLPMGNNNKYLYKNLRLEITIPDVIKNPQYTIKDSDNEDRTAKFNIISFANNKLILEAKQSGGLITDLEMYDKDIRINITGQLDETKKDGPGGWGQYIDGDYVKLPIAAGSVVSNADGKVYNEALNSTVVELYYPAAYADPKIMVYDKSLNTTLAQLKSDAFIATYFDNLQDGATNNTFEVIDVGTTVTDINLGNVGFAGQMQIKITNNLSGRSATYKVPINIVDSDTGYSGGYAIRAVDFTWYNLTSVPSTEDGRKTFVKTQTELKAWDMRNGNDLATASGSNPKLELTGDNSFFTDNSPIEGTHIFTYTTSNTTNGPTKQVTGRFESDVLTITITPGSFKVCENAGQSSTFGLSGTGSSNASNSYHWYFYDRTTLAWVSLVTGNTLKVENVVANSGKYKVTSDNHPGLEPECYLSVAPTNIYWSKTATNQNWNDVDNWTDVDGNKVYAVPHNCSDVYLPLINDNAWYPNLKPDPTGATGTNYSIWNFGDAVINNLILENRAMLATPDRLEYNKVEVNITLKNEELDRWVFYSAPLRNLYAGDFMAGVYHGQNNEQQINRAVYISYFERKNPDYPSNPIKEKEFTLPVMKIEEPLYNINPFMIYVDPKLVQGNISFKYPGILDKYVYTNLPPQGDTNSTQKNSAILDRSNSGRFAYERIGNPSGYSSFTLTYYSENEYVLVSNPYPAFLNLNKFLEENGNSLVADEYKIWDGQSDFIIKDKSADGKNIVWRISSTAQMDNVTSSPEVHIPPFQSFFVKRKSSGSGDISLIYHGANMTLVKSVTGGYTLE